MTRINTVVPKQLTDSHLIAEYREILRPINLSIKKFEKHGNAMLDHIPPNFKLGQGHVLFFYDKLKYLHDRFKHICDEMSNRKFNFTMTFDETKFTNDVKNVLYNDWLPNINDIKISQQRLIEKVSMQNHKYYGKPIDKAEYMKLLNL